MSNAPTISDTDDPPEPTDPEELIEENRDLIERIAAADLPISERLQRALDVVDGGDDV